MWQLTWHMRKIRLHVLAYRTLRVTHVCMCAINENKQPFQDFCYFISRILPMYPSDFNYFHHVGLFSSIFMRR